MTPPSPLKRWLAVVSVVAAALVAAAPPPAAFVERAYATSIYPRWARTAVTLTDAVPFAAFDVLLVALLVALALAAVRGFRRSNAVSTIGRLARATAAVTVTASVVYLWFLAAWGFNYHRVPLKQRLGYDRTRVSAVAARELAERTVSELNRLHPAAWSRPWPDYADVPRSLTGARDRTAIALQLPVGVQGGRPKPSLLQPYFRWAGIDGVTNPFLPEILVNRDLLPTERAFVVAHEWGHLSGLAHEAEASYAGWRLCLASDEQAQYSAWLSVYGAVLGALPRDLQAPIIAALADGPRRDLRAIAARYRQAVPTVRDVAWSAYDRYLRSNRVSEGVASYDAVVDLILGVR